MVDPRSQESQHNLARRFGADHPRPNAEHVHLIVLDRLVRRIGSLLADVAPSARLVVFGHLAEGNLHVNVLGLDDTARDVVRTAVLELTIALGGTISAEHGIGVAKADWMERLHGPTHVAVLRSVKDALDPAGAKAKAEPVPTKSGSWANGSAVILLIGKDYANKTLAQIAANAGAGTATGNSTANSTPTVTS